MRPILNLLLAVSLLLGGQVVSAAEAQSPRQDKPSSGLPEKPPVEVLPGEDSIVPSFPPIIPEGEALGPVDALAGGVSQSGLIVSMVFSADGKRVVSVDFSGAIRLCDIASGKEIASLVGPAAWSLTGAFNADGTQLAWIVDDRAVIWDVAKAKEIAGINGVAADFQSVAIGPEGRPDGTLLALGDESGTIQVWEAADSKDPKKLGDLDGREWVTSLAFSTDGSHLASGGLDGIVRVWDLTTMADVPGLGSHDDSVRSVAFSRDGKRLASVGDDGTVRVWDLERRTQVARFEWGGGGLRSVLFSPDGSRLAVGAGDGVIRLWDLTEGREIPPLESHEGPIRALSFNSNGTLLASGGQDGDIRLWHVASGEEMVHFEGHRSGVASVAFSPDGKLLASGGQDRAIRLWDTATGAEHDRLEGYTSGVGSVTFSRDGAKLASLGGEGEIRLWDMNSGREMARLRPDPLSLPLSLALSRDAALLAWGDSDGLITLWDVAKRMGASFKAHGDWVRSVAFSPDGMQLVSAGDDGTIRLWDVSTKTEIAHSEVGRDWIMSAAFGLDPFGSGERRLASISQFGELRLWRVAGEKITSELNWPADEDQVPVMAFSQDGRYLASDGPDGTVRIWSVATGMGNAVPIGHTDSVASMAFSPDGALLALGSPDGTVSLLDVAGGRARTVSLGGRGGTWLSCNVDKARCWRADDGTLLVHRDPLGNVIGPILPDVKRIGTRPEVTFNPPRGVAEGAAPVSVVVRNIDTEPLFWLRLSGIETHDSGREAAVRSSEILPRLDPGAKATLKAEIVSRLPFQDPRSTTLVPSFHLEVSGHPPLELGKPDIKLQSPWPKIDKAELGDILGDSRPLIATLTNAGDAPFDPLPEVDGELLDNAGTALGPPMKAGMPTTGSLAPSSTGNDGNNVQMSFSLAKDVDPAKVTTLRLTVRDSRYPFHEWALDVPVDLVPMNWPAWAAVATLILLTVMALIYYQRIYRHPLLTSLSSEPQSLLRVELEQLPSAQSLLSQTRRLATVLDAAGSVRVWLDRAIAFANAPAEDKAQILAQRLEGKASPAVELGSHQIPWFQVDLPDDFVLKIEHLFFIVPAPNIDAEEVLAAWRNQQTRISDVFVVVSTAVEQRRMLLRFSEKIEQIVVPSGGDITSLLLGPKPLETFARLIAHRIDPSKISPYQTNSAVMRESVFYGRVQQLKHILNRELGNYIVVGARQLGKSSLLKAIERHVRRRGDLEVIYLYIHAAAIVPTLARAVGVAADAPLASVVEKLRQPSNGRCRLFLLDEADDFVDRDRQNDPSFVVLDAMRGLSAEGSCHFILTGFWALYAMTHIDYYSPLRNFGETLVLGALEPAAANDLLVHPMETLGIHWSSSGLVQRVKDETGCRPNLLQIVCNRLIRQLDKRRVIDEKDVTDVLASTAVVQALEGWRELTSDPRSSSIDKIVVWSMLKNESFELGDVRRTLGAYEEAARISTREIQLSLQRLELAFIVREKDGVYTWCVPLFRKRRLLEEPASQLREEMDILQCRRLQADLNI